MSTFRSGVQILSQVSKTQGRGLLHVRSYSADRQSVSNRQPPAEWFNKPIQPSHNKSPQLEQPTQSKRSRSWFSLFHREETPPPPKAVPPEKNSHQKDDSPWLSLFKKKEIHHELQEEGRSQENEALDSQGRQSLVRQSDVRKIITEESDGPIICQNTTRQSKTPPPILETRMLDLQARRLHPYQARLPSTKHTSSVSHAKFKAAEHKITRKISFQNKEAYDQFTQPQLQVPFVIKGKQQKFTFQEYKKPNQLNSKFKATHPDENKSSDDSYCPVQSLKSPSVTHTKESLQKNIIKKLKKPENTNVDIDYKTESLDTYFAEEKTFRPPCEVNNKNLAENLHTHQTCADTCKTKKINNHQSAAHLKVPYQILASEEAPQPASLDFKASSLHKSSFSKVSKRDELIQSQKQMPEHNVHSYQSQSSLAENSYQEMKVDEDSMCKEKQSKTYQNISGIENRHHLCSSICKLEKTPTEWVKDLPNKNIQDISQKMSVKPPYKSSPVEDPPLPDSLRMKPTKSVGSGFQMNQKKMGEMDAFKKPVIFRSASTDCKIPPHPKRQYSNIASSNQTETENRWDNLQNMNELTEYNSNNSTNISFVKQEHIHKYPIKPSYSEFIKEKIKKKKMYSESTIITSDGKKSEKCKTSFPGSEDSADSKKISTSDKEIKSLSDVHKNEGQIRKPIKENVQITTPYDCRMNEQKFNVNKLTETKSRNIESHKSQSSGCLKYQFRASSTGCERERIIGKEAKPPPACKYEQSSTNQDQRLSNSKKLLSKHISKREECENYSRKNSLKQEFECGQVKEQNELKFPKEKDTFKSVCKPDPVKKTHTKEDATCLKGDPPKGEQMCGKTDGKEVAIGTGKNNQMSKSDTCKTEQLKQTPMNAENTNLKKESVCCNKDIHKATHAIEHTCQKEKSIHQSTCKAEQHKLLSSCEHSFKKYEPQITFLNQYTFSKDKSKCKQPANKDVSKTKCTNGYTFEIENSSHKSTCKKAQPTQELEHSKVSQKSASECGLTSNKESSKRACSLEYKCQNDNSTHKPTELPKQAFLKEDKICFKDSKTPASDRGVSGTKDETTSATKISYESEKLKQFEQSHMKEGKDSFNKCTRKPPPACGQKPTSETYQLNKIHRKKEISCFNMDSMKPPPSCYNVPSINPSETGQVSLEYKPIEPKLSLAKLFCTPKPGPACGQIYNNSTVKTLHRDPSHLDPSKINTRENAAIRLERKSTTEIKAECQKRDVKTTPSDGTQQNYNTGNISELSNNAENLYTLHKTDKKYGFQQNLVKICSYEDLSRQTHNNKENNNLRSWNYSHNEPEILKDNVNCKFRIASTEEKTNNGWKIQRDCITLTQKQVDANNNEQFSVELKSSYYEGEPCSYEEMYIETEMSKLYYKENLHEEKPLNKKAITRCTNTGTISAMKEKDSYVHEYNKGIIRSFSDHKIYDPNTHTPIETKSEKKPVCKKMPFDQSATQKREGECLKIKVPGCNKPKSITCKAKTKKIGECIRIPPPWPSYSECLKEDPPDPRYTECNLKRGPTCDTVKKRNSYDGCNPPDTSRKPVCPPKISESSKKVELKKEEKITEKPQDKSPCQECVAEDCKKKLSGPFKRSYSSTSLKCLSGTCLINQIPQHNNLSIRNYSDMKIDHLSLSSPIQCQSKESHKGSGLGKEGKDKCKKIPFEETATQKREGECLKIKVPGCNKPKSITCKAKTKKIGECIRIPPPWPSYSECLKEVPPDPRYTECNLKRGPTCDIVKKRNSYDGCNPPDTSRKPVCPPKTTESSKKVELKKEEKITEKPQGKSPCQECVAEDCKNKLSGPFKRSYSSTSLKCLSGTCLINQIPQKNNLSIRNYSDMKIDHLSLSTPIQCQSKQSHKGSGLGKEGKDKCKKMPFEETATQKREGECLKIKVPGCNKPKSITCKAKTKKIGECTRIPPPWPSYSECLKEVPPDPRYTECNLKRGPTCDIVKKRNSYDGCNPPDTSRKPVCPPKTTEPSKKVELKKEEKITEKPQDKSPHQECVAEDCKKKLAGPLKQGSSATSVKCSSATCLFNQMPLKNNFPTRHYSDMKINNLTLSSSMQCQSKDITKGSQLRKKDGEKDKCKKMPFEETATQKREGECLKIKVPGCNKPKSITCKAKTKKIGECTRIPPPWPSYSECLKEDPPDLRYTECNLKRGPTCDIVKKRNSYDGCNPPDTSRKPVCPPKATESSKKVELKKEAKITEKPQDKSPCQECVAEDCKKKLSGPFKRSYSSTSLKCLSGTCLINQINQENNFPTRHYSDMKINNLTLSTPIQCQSKESHKGSGLGKEGKDKCKKMPFEETATQKREGECLKIKVPGCNKPKSITCKAKTKKIKECTRIPPPWPSYSECLKEDPPDPRYTECNLKRGPTCDTAKKRNFYDGCNPPDTSRKSVCPPKTTESSKKVELKKEENITEKPQDKSPCQECVGEDCKKKLSGPFKRSYSSTSLKCLSGTCLINQISQENNFPTQHYSDMKINNLTPSSPIQCQSKHTSKVSEFGKKDGEKEKCKKMPFEQTVTQNREGESLKTKIPGCNKPKSITCKAKTKKIGECTRIPPLWPSYSECLKEDPPDPRYTEFNLKIGPTCDTSKKRNSYDCCNPPDTSRMTVCPPKRTEPSKKLELKKEEKITEKLQGKSPCQECVVEDCKKKLAGPSEDRFSSTPMECSSGSGITNQLSQKYYFPKHFFSDVMIAQPFPSVPVPLKQINSLYKTDVQSKSDHILANMTDDITGYNHTCGNNASMLNVSSSAGLLNNVIRRYYSDDQYRNKSKQSRTSSNKKFKESDEDSGSPVTCGLKSDKKRGRCETRTSNQGTFIQCPKPTPPVIAHKCAVKKKRTGVRRPIIVKEVEPPKYFVECKKPEPKTIKYQDNEGGEKPVKDVIVVHKSEVKPFIACPKPPMPEKLGTCLQERQKEKTLPPPGRCKMVKMKPFIQCSKPPPSKDITKKCSEERITRNKPRLCNEERRSKNKLCYVENHSNNLKPGYSSKLPSVLKKGNGSRFHNVAPKQSRSASTKSHSNSREDCKKMPFNKSSEKKLGVLCKKIKMPGCTVPQSLKCVKKAAKNQNKCSKVLAPSKSYSECCKEPSAKSKASECTSKQNQKYLQPKSPVLEPNRHKTKPPEVNLYLDPSIKCDTQVKQPQPSETIETLTEQPKEALSKSESNSFMDIIKSWLSFFKAREGCPEPGDWKKRKLNKTMPTIIEETEDTTIKNKEDTAEDKSKMDSTLNEVGQLMFDNSQCKRMHLPGCKPPESIDCKPKTRKHTDCKKVPAPKPSFSECQKDPLRKTALSECNVAKMKQVSLKKPSVSLSATQITQELKKEELTLKCKPQEKHVDFKCSSNANQEKKHKAPKQSWCIFKRRNQKKLKQKKKNKAQTKPEPLPGNSLIQCEEYSKKDTTKEKEISIKDSVKPDIKDNSSNSETQANKSLSKENKSGIEETEMMEAPNETKDNSFKAKIPTEHKIEDKKISDSVTDELQVKDTKHKELVSREIKKEKGMSPDNASMREDVATHDKKTEHKSPNACKKEEDKNKCDSKPYRIPVKEDIPKAIPSKECKKMKEKTKRTMCDKKKESGKGSQEKKAKVTKERDPRVIKGIKKEEPKNSKSLYSSTLCMLKREISTSPLTTELSTESDLVSSTLKLNKSQTKSNGSLFKRNSSSVPSESCKVHSMVSNEMIMKGQSDLMVDYINISIEQSTQHANTQKIHCLPIDLQSHETPSYSKPEREHNPLYINTTKSFLVKGSTASSSMYYPKQAYSTMPSNVEVNYLLQSTYKMDKMCKSEFHQGKPSIFCKKDDSHRDSKCSENKPVSKNEGKPGTCSGKTVNEDPPMSTAEKKTGSSSNKSTKCKKMRFICPIEESKSIAKKKEDDIAELGEFPQHPCGGKEEVPKTTSETITENSKKMDPSNTSCEQHKETEHKKVDQPTAQCKAKDNENQIQSKSNCTVDEASKCKPEHKRKEHKSDFKDDEAKKVVCLSEIEKLDECKKLSKSDCKVDEASKYKTEHEKEEQHELERKEIKKDICLLTIEKLDECKKQSKSDCKAEEATKCKTEHKQEEHKTECKTNEITKSICLPTIEKLDESKNQSNYDCKVDEATKCKPEHEKEEHKPDCKSEEVKKNECLPKIEKLDESKKLSKSDCKVEVSKCKTEHEKKEQHKTECTKMQFICPIEEPKSIAKKEEGITKLDECKEVKQDVSLPTIEKMDECKKLSKSDCKVDEASKYKTEHEKEEQHELECKEIKKDVCLLTIEKLDECKKQSKPDCKVEVSKCETENTKETHKPECKETSKPELTLNAPSHTSESTSTATETEISYSACVWLNEYRKDSASRSPPTCVTAEQPKPFLRCKEGLEDSCITKSSTTKKESSCDLTLAECDKSSPTSNNEKLSPTSNNEKSSSTSNNEQVKTEVHKQDCEWGDAKIPEMGEDGVLKRSKEEWPFKKNSC